MSDQQKTPFREEDVLWRWTPAVNPKTFRRENVALEYVVCVPSPKSRYRPVVWGRWGQTWFNTNAGLRLVIAELLRAREEGEKSGRDKEREVWQIAWADLRDTVLHERGALAEMNASNDVINAVLGEMDDALTVIEAKIKENPV